MSRAPSMSLRHQGAVASTIERAAALATCSCTPDLLIATTSTYDGRVLTVEMVEPLRQRFWGKVDLRGPDECWPWLASLHSAGYGQIRVGGQAGRVRPA